MTRIPLDYLDKICFGASSEERGVSSAPVWQLRIEGDFDEEVAARAMGFIAQRYPVLVSRVVSMQEGIPVLDAPFLAYAVDDEPRIDKLFRTLDLSGVVPQTDDQTKEAAIAEAFAAFQQEQFDHFIDLENDYPVRFIWVRRSASEGVLMIQQHHSIADGRAFFGLLEDFCVAYDQVLDGTLPSSAEPVPKLSEMLVAEAQPWRRARYRFYGTFMHMWNIVRYSFRPPDQLVSNTDKNFTGHSQHRHLDIDAEGLARIRSLRGATGYSPNDVLGGALARSLADWSESYGHPVRRFNLLMIADVRPRGVEIQSFGNHLSSFLVDFDLKRHEAPLALMEHLAREVRRQAKRSAPAKKILAEISFARRLSVAKIREAVYKQRYSMLNYSFSNLLGITPKGPGGRFAASRWSAEDLRIMTPSPWAQGLNTTALEYGGRICFNFNHKESIIDAAMVEDLKARYLLQIDGLVNQALSAGPRK